MNQLEQPVASRRADLDEPVTNGKVDDTGTIWAALRAQQEDALADRSIDIDVPGGLLQLRCGPINGQVQGKLAERIRNSKSPERDFNVNADYLIAACRVVLGRASAGDEYEELVDDDSEPIRLDQRLSDKLGLPQGTTARSLLRALFVAAPSPELAVTVAGGQYVSWAAALDGGEEALGES